MQVGDDQGDEHILQKPIADLCNEMERCALESRVPFTRIGMDELMNPDEEDDNVGIYSVETVGRIIAGLGGEDQSRELP